ncbi:MAG: dipeptide epimerase [Thaumarchaeota archaeon]|nr:dipeptide epimerase [Nitrososphaerota archaeon]
MKITKVEIYPLHIDYKPDRIFYVSYGPITRLENVVVKVHTDEDIVGLGEAAAVFPFGESQDSAVGFLKRVSAKLVGMDPRNITQILDQLDIIAGNLGAKTAIDFALYDILGKASGQPVYRLLGGLRKQRVPIHITVPIKKPEEMAQEAKMRVEEGFKTIEMKVGKVGGSVDNDLEIARVREVRDAIGYGITLVVDANIGWSARTAINIIKRIEQFDVMVEQPTRSINGLAEVRKSVAATIIADESCATPEDVIEIIQKQAADMISVKPAKMGGLNKSGRIIAIAESAGMIYRYDGMEQTRLACTASLHLAMATAKDVCGGFSQFTRQGQDLVKTGGIVLDNGIARLENIDTPGLGVELDEHLLGAPVVVQ